MAIALTVCRFCLVVLLVVSPGRGAPRSKGSKSSRRDGPQTIYDQKQKGWANVQVHLKDVQIIALLGDDYLGGDYDYNYDYADFTLKPSTHKPSTEATPSSHSPTTASPQTPPSTTTAVVAESNPTPSPSKEPPVKKQEKPLTDKNTDKPVTPEVEKPSNETKKPSIEAEKPSNEVEKPSDAVEKLPPPPVNVTEAVVEIVESSTVPLRVRYEEPNSPGKIKVQIIETPMGVVPGELTDKDGVVKASEAVPLKRCATGFGRDKLGRCRRLKRRGSASPHLPYNFSRLTSNLMSRLRQASSEESQPSSESSED